jgi:hypothetical protein
MPTLFLPWTPNAGAHLLPEAGAERTLEAVRFRVKAPVPRRPPHSSGREGCPHPVPRSPAACVPGEPPRRHPVWRIPVLSLARLAVGQAPGLGERQGLLEGSDHLLPASVALVAAAAQPVAPSPLGMLEDPCEPCAMAPETLGVGGATQFRTARPILRVPGRLALVTTPCPNRLPTPAQAFPDRLAREAPVSTACCGPRVGQSKPGEAPRPPGRCRATWRPLERHQRRLFGMHGQTATVEALRQAGQHPARGGCQRAAAEAIRGQARHTAPALPPGRHVLDTPCVQDLRQAHGGP